MPPVTKRPDAQVHPITDDLGAPRAKRLGTHELPPCPPVPPQDGHSSAEPRRALTAAHHAMRRKVSILWAEAVERHDGQRASARRVGVSPSQMQRYCDPDQPDGIWVADAAMDPFAGPDFFRSLLRDMADEAPPSTLAPEQHGWALTELHGRLAGATRKALLDGRWDQDEYREQDAIAADMEHELARFRAELRRRMGGR